MLTRWESHYKTKKISLGQDHNERASDQGAQGDHTASSTTAGSDVSMYKRFPKTRHFTYNCIHLCHFTAFIYFSFELNIWWMLLFSVSTSGK